MTNINNTLNNNIRGNNTNTNKHEKDTRNIKRNQIYWGDLPCIEGSSIQHGLHPVLILQNDVGNKYSSNVHVCGITSQVRKSTLPTQVSVKRDNINNLDRDSVVQTESTTDIPKFLLGDYIGEFTEDIIKKINIALAIQLGLKEMITQRPIIRLETIDMKVVENKIFFIRKTKEMYNACKQSDLLRMYKLSLEELKNYTHKCGKDISLYYDDTNDIIDTDTRIARAV